jgi:hypothetical protein
MKQNLSGVGSRLYVSVMNKIKQEDPQLFAYTNLIKRSGYEQARKIEGGRVTDQDRQIITDTLFNPIARSSEADLYQAKFLIEDFVYTKGASRKDPVLATFYAEANSQLGKNTLIRTPDGNTIEIPKEEKSNIAKIIKDYPGSEVVFDNEVDNAR